AQDQGPYEHRAAQGFHQDHAGAAAAAQNPGLQRAQNNPARHPCGKHGHRENHRWHQQYVRVIHESTPQRFHSASHLFQILTKGRRYCRTPILIRETARSAAPERQRDVRIRVSILTFALALAGVLPADEPSAWDLYERGREAEKSGQMAEAYLLY